MTKKRHGRAPNDCHWGVIHRRYDAPMLAIALICLLPALCHAQAVKHPPDRWALLIGVDKYVHARPLRYCGADMRDLRKELVDRGFPERQVFLMRDKAPDERDLPVKALIQERIEQVLRFAEQDDLVLIAFSGHGVQIKGKSYLCATDGRLDDSKTLISLDWLYGQVNRCPAALKLVLVDACRDVPEPDADKGGAGAPAPFAADAVPPEGMLLLTSCAEGEVSKEDEELGHGVFTHFVIDGLRGRADVDRDGHVSLDELIKYSAKETKLHVDTKFKASQRPKIKGDYTAEAMSFEIGLVASGSPARIDPRPTRPTVPPNDETPTDEKTFTNSIGMKFKLIPAGEFWMGAADGEEGPDKDEKPRHKVRITQPFHMGVYEVTQQEYERVMGENPSYFAGGGGGAGKVSGLDTRRFPVEQVSWEDAKAFCEKLSELPEERAAGRAYRLPTEAEWEYACRARTTTPFSFGAVLTGRGANCDGNYPYGTTEKGPYLGRTTTVGSYRNRANAFGLYDMHGNVWEWCADWYGGEYYANSPTSDPQGPEDPTAGSIRVIRGGGWGSSPVYCRSARRGRGEPAYRSTRLGFRVVRAR